MKHNRIVTVLLIAISFCLVLSNTSLRTYAGNNNDSMDRVMVSMGDSYSSGEGVEDFYGQDLSEKNRAKNEDFLAHRSKQSWPGKLKINNVDGSMSKHKYNGNNSNTANWYFVASSGAETKHYNGNSNKKHTKTIGQKKTYDRNGISKTTYLDPQLKVFETLKEQGRSADYVTMTIGGNDVGFSDIITKSVIEGNSYLLPVFVADQLNDAWEEFYSEGGAKDRIRQAYLDVREASGDKTNIIVAGYPKLISTTPLPQSYFSISEALMIDASVSKFNNEIKSIISELSKKDKNIYFVSVENEFNKHEAYSVDSYINGIMLNQKYDLKDIKVSDPATMVSAYSMHPNEKGTKAYARCVQKVIDSIENKQQKKISPFIKKLCSSKWAMIGPYYEGLSDSQFRFSSDGYVMIDSLRHEMKTEKFPYTVVDNSSIEFSTGSSDFQYKIYQIESEDFLRFKSSVYDSESQGLLVKMDEKNNSEQILNIFAGGDWYSDYFYKKYATDNVFAEGDGHGNTTLNLGFFGQEKAVEGYTLYGKGITDNLALFVPYTNKDMYVFVENCSNGKFDKAYIFDDGKFILEKWKHQFSNG